jgi:peptide/nickel transport system substrate-binding protein
MNAYQRHEGGLYVPDRSGLTRRGFVSLMGLGVGAAAVGGLASACSSDSGSTTPPAGKPKRGGTLRVGVTGGGLSDTLDQQAGLGVIDFARGTMLYDTLCRLDNKGSLQMGLAESITSNRDATEWTIKVRPGVTTHRGKSFGAEDVLFSLRRIVDNSLYPSFGFGAIDLKNSKALDDTTVLIKYGSSFAVFPEALANLYTVMYPVGWDVKNPDGTGPFMYKSFTAGTESTFVRNPNYWGGDVYLDAITVTNIADEDAQVNALRSGQVDAINQLSASSATTLRAGGFNVITSDTGTSGLFTMNVETAPFDDVRVRQAFCLAIDRQGMLDQVFGGMGRLGNDVFGIYDPVYNSELPQREQDTDRAKSLLKEAGFDSLKVDLYTGSNFAGQELAAQVFATQVKSAGIEVNLISQNATDYFASSYGKVPFSQDFWGLTPYFSNVAMSIASGANGPFNPTHFNDAEYNELYAQAIAETDVARRTELAHEMQAIEYDRGSQALPYWMPQIDACAPNVQGVEESVTGYGPGGMYWSDFWLSD